MVNAINSGISPIQLINAANAFKNISAKPEQIIEEMPVSEGIDIQDNADLLKEIDVKDIQKYASSVGENALNEDDIRYGLTYGRSIIADWVV